MVASFLRELGAREQDFEAASARMASEQGADDGLTLEQLRALVSSLEPPSPSAENGGITSSPSSSSVVSKSPLKKVLSKNRPYLGTGHLVMDDSVVAYMQKLEEHRKKW